MSRLEILKNSLVKKEKKFDGMIQNHFDTVRSANGQPLNDKRNGHATLARWEKQNDAIRRQQEEIEKTKRAIDREEDKVNDTAAAYSKMPDYLKTLIDDGTLNQWRKHPRILFVNGVEKARLYFNEETGLVSHKYVGQIPDNQQYNKFRDVFNALNAIQKQLVKEDKKTVKINIKNEAKVRAAMESVHADSEGIAFKALKTSRNLLYC